MIIKQLILFLTDVMDFSQLFVQFLFTLKLLLQNLHLSLYCIGLLFINNISIYSCLNVLRERILLRALHRSFFFRRIDDC